MTSHDWSRNGIFSADPPTKATAVGRASRAARRLIPRAGSTPITRASKESARNVENRPVPDPRSRMVKPETPGRNGATVVRHVAAE